MIETLIVIGITILGAILGPAITLVIFYCWSKIASREDPSAEGAYAMVWGMVVAPISLAVGAIAGLILGIYMVWN